jgi:hypothetical protein
MQAGAGFRLNPVFRSKCQDERLAVSFCARLEAENVPSSRRLVIRPASRLTRSPFARRTFAGVD